MEVNCQFWTFNGPNIRPDIINKIKLIGSSGFVVIYNVAGKYLDTLENWLEFISEVPNEVKTEYADIYQVLVIRNQTNKIHKIYEEKIKEIIAKWRINLNCFIEEIEINLNLNNSDLDLHALKNSFKLFVQRTASSALARNPHSNKEIILKFVFLGYDGRLINELRNIVLDYEPDSKRSSLGAEFIVKRYDFDN